MHLVFGRLAFMVTFGDVLFALEIGSGQAILELGRGGSLLNAVLTYGRHKVGRGVLDWQWRRGLVQHCLLWGDKFWAGSRYWTDADLPPVQPLNTI